MARPCSPSPFSSVEAHRSSQTDIFIATACAEAEVLCSGTTQGRAAAASVASPQKLGGCGDVLGLGWGPTAAGCPGVGAVACRLSPVAGEQRPAAALSEPRQAAKGQGRVPPPSGRPGRKSCCFQVGKWLKGLKNKRINPKSGPPAPHRAASGTQRGGQGGGGRPPQPLRRAGKGNRGREGEPGPLSALFGRILTAFIYFFLALVA